MHACVHVKSRNKASEYGGEISNFCYLSSDLIIVKLICVCVGEEFACRAVHMRE